jgi:hypothetical protein
MAEGLVMYEKPKCLDCKFFCADRTSREYAGRQLEGKLEGGECRRHAPVVVPTLIRSLEIDKIVAHSFFPIVYDDDYCGEFRARNDF